MAKYKRNDLRAALYLASSVSNYTRDEQAFVGFALDYMKDRVAPSERLQTLFSRMHSEAKQAYAALNVVTGLALNGGAKEEVRRLRQEKRFHAEHMIDLTGAFVVMAKPRIGKARMMDDMSQALRKGRAFEFEGVPKKASEQIRNLIV